MFKIYGDFADFVNALKARDKTIEILIKKIPHRNDETRILSAEILVQFLDKDDLCHTHHYIDGLKAVKLLPAGAFNNISDDKARAFEEQRYSDILMEFDSIINEEYKKAIDLFNQLGYKNINESCYITA